MSGSNTALHCNSFDHALRPSAERAIADSLGAISLHGFCWMAIPQFFDRAEGCHLVDADGCLFIDMVCSSALIVHGYHHRVVDKAVAPRTARAVRMNGPPPRVGGTGRTDAGHHPHADWCQFGKNGTDVATTRVPVARAVTGRRKILVARGTYHGATPWCSPSAAGSTAKARRHLLFYTHDDIASLHAEAKAAGHDLAAVMVSAYCHDMRQPQVLPTPDFAPALRALRNENSAALAPDNVLADFQIDPGGSWKPLEVQSDLSAWSEAVANAHPLSAIAGQAAVDAGLRYAAR